MIIVVIAGGQGTRLWPLSKTDYPKHLLSLINENSLLQNTINRVRGLSDTIYIVPEASHVDEVKKQLPGFIKNIILEPARRGTAHCIAYALAELKKHHNQDEVVVFLHADHHIDDIKSFHETVTATAQTASDLHRIALIGIAPNYPATGFGYIKTGQEVTNKYGLPVLEVENFVEKPNATTAQEYLKSNQYLWNLGLFAGTIEVFEQAMKKFSPALFERYQLLAKPNADKKYLDFPSAPIDTELIEKIDNLVVVPGHFDWADVGSFKDLYEILHKGEKNVHKGQL